jgi:uncharacterized protein (DUF305 family)
MQEKIMYGVIGLLVGVIATWAFANTAVNSHHPGMMNMMGMGQSSQMMNNIDKHFIEQMIPHHADAIAMGHLALEKAQHQEIKDLAQNIIGSQSTEIDQMKSWYQGWFNTTVPDVFKNTDHGTGSGMIHGGMMNNETDISTLRSADPFDKAFIEEMIPHHQMAVMMAQMLEQSTTRPEMKKLAQDIISAQNKEIEQMRNWYSQWYK